MDPVDRIAGHTADFEVASSSTVITKFDNEKYLRKSEECA
jgi:hypothetical protein